MHIGVCRLRIHIPASQSLKDKRQVVKSIITRLRNTHNMSVMEVDSHDLWQIATLGIACVGIEPTALRELMYRTVDQVASNSHGAEVVEHEVDVLSLF